MRTPDTDRLTLRGNVDRESSDDRGVNHIHHTSINPHTAIVACTMNKYIRTHFKGNPSKESPSDRNNSALSWVVHSPGLSSAPWSRMKTTGRFVEKTVKPGHMKFSYEDRMCIHGYTNSVAPLRELWSCR